jgi:hypothetical protein
MTVRLFHTAGTVGQLAHCTTRTGTSRAVHIGEGFLPNNIPPKINAIITVSLTVKFLNVLNNIKSVRVSQVSLVNNVRKSFKARCHGDILRAGKSRWQVGYRVSLYCHQGWKYVYLSVTFGYRRKTLLTKLMMLLF